MLKVGSFLIHLGLVEDFGSKAERRSCSFCWYCSFVSRLLSNYICCSSL